MFQPYKGTILKVFASKSGLSSLTGGDPRAQRSSAIGVSVLTSYKHGHTHLTVGAGKPGTTFPSKQDVCPHAGCPKEQSALTDVLPLSWTELRTSTGGGGLAQCPQKHLHPLGTDLDAVRCSSRRKVSTATGGSIC